MTPPTTAEIEAAVEDWDETVMRELALYAVKQSEKFMAYATKGDLGITRGVAYGLVLGLRIAATRAKAAES